MAAATASETFHGWSALPNEIKLEVLAYHLSYRTGQSPDRIDMGEHTRMLTGDLGRISSTRNRELVGLAIDAYYKTNTFQAWILNKRKGLSVNIGNVTMTYPPTVHGAKIRRLEVVSLECVTGYALPDMLLPIQSGWRFLLDPKTTHVADTASANDADLLLDSAQSVSSRARFPNLRTLKLDLVIRDLPSERVREHEDNCCTTPSKLEQLEGWLANTTFKIKADKVYVLVLVGGGAD
jgi:hypothetical protein